MLTAADPFAFLLLGELWTVYKTKKFLKSNAEVFLRLMPVLGKYLSYKVETEDGRGWRCSESVSRVVFCGQKSGRSSSWEGWLVTSRKRDLEGSCERKNCRLHGRKWLEHALGPWLGKVSVQADFLETQRRWLNGVDVREHVGNK